MSKFIMTQYRLRIIATAVVLVTTVGCGGPFDSSAKGTVTLNGTTLPSGWITFYPTAGGPIAYARIDDNGSFEARTGNSEGLQPGEYQVTIIANEPPKELRSKDGGPPPAGKQITPPWYALKDKSGLSVTVKPGTNDIPLTLNSTPPAGWKAGAKN